MDSTHVLILLLAGSLATFISGDKLASKIALLFGVASFGFSCYLLSLFQSGQNIDFIAPWISNPNISFALKADGLSLTMLLLTTALTPLIILSGFGNSFKNSKAIYALILFMSFAMAGTFLAADGLLYYIFWELALIPIYFIALLWGNGDEDSRKKAVVKFPEVIMEALNKNGLTPADIHLLIPHQANLRISQFVQQKLQLADSQVYNNIQHYGNTTAASVPIALCEAWEKGMIEKGNLVCLAAFGSGFTWGSALIRW
jgi:hypothetical protein